MNDYRLLPGQRAYSIAAIDPGVTTGVAWACVGRKELRDLGAHGALLSAMNHGRWQGEDIRGANDTARANAIFMWLNGRHEATFRVTNDYMRAVGVVVIEDFVRREDTTDPSLLAPVRIMERLLQAWDGDESMVVFKQQPSQAKAVVTDHRLKDWGLWSKGSRHVRDANRHLIILLRNIAAASQSI